MPAAGAARSGAEAGGDWDFAPDIVVKDGEIDRGRRLALRGVHTPGHTSNHLCFALPDKGILFSGDHVMGWSTSVIAPPDGNMADYMASLDKLLERTDAVYWPTHGPAITEPKRHVRAFIAHRREREAEVIDLPQGSGSAPSTRWSIGFMSGSTRACVMPPAARCWRICSI